jgi:Prokaryotic Cytochrome C oxidase subunit IV
VTALLLNRIMVVWLALIAATLVSWWLGTDHGIDDARIVSVGVLLAAFVKVRFVGMYFMELRNAPIALRLIYEGWCVVVCATVIALFLAL